MKTIKSQSGHAALLFALFIPVLFGVFALATDGARAIQDKARLEEATEVAALAVAGQNSDDKSVQKATAKKYIEYYFPNATVSNDNLTVVKLNCEDNPLCSDSSEEQRFFQYSVNASIVETSWFPGNKAIVGIGETYDVAGYSVARKYQSEAVDVILVADFSASMFEYWEGGSKRKYQDLKDIIEEVADELAKYNELNIDQQNTLAVVGFDFYTSRYNSSNKRKFYDHLVCSETVWDWDYGWRKKNTRCSSSSPGSDASDVNATETVAQIFNTSHFSHEPVKGSVTNISQFHDIDLTSDMESLVNELNQYRAFYISSGGGSGTSSYAGLIRGAQVAITGDNPRRIIILLSDGEDSYPQTTTKLISAGMCSTIYNTLNAQETSGGDSVTARMVAVGFDYQISKYPQMKNCVGEDNVYEAEDTDAIKNKILELITEEIGHLAP